jgi:hypothetical protein
MVLGVTDESVVVYESMADAENGEEFDVVYLD